MRTFYRLAIRIALGLLVFIVLLTTAGFVYQTVATINDQHNTSLPGEMIDVDGYHLHISVMGNADTGPTVILENGGGGIVPQWGWIQPEIAQFTQVVAYDRPGTGWSESPPEPLDAVGSVQALHEALDTLGIEGPYVLVGHSMGGLMMRVFTKLYPDEVAGMVLIDPRVLSWQGIFTEEEARVPTEIYRVLQVLAHFGVTRLTGLAANQVEGLPEESYEEAVAIGSTPKYMAGLVADARYGETAIDFLLDGENLQDVPMIVMSAGAPDESFNASQRENFIALHAQLAARSSQGEHRIVQGAGHLSIVMRQEFTEDVTKAVSEMVMQGAAQQSSARVNN